FSVSVLLYSSSIVLTFPTPHPAHDTIEPRYIIQGQPPPPCKNHICPLANTMESPIESRATTEPNLNTASSFPRPHQTAPVKCGDTGLPPPCNVTPENYTSDSRLVLFQTFIIRPM
ncbi:secreted protein, partial [Melampsora americana]